MQPQKAQAVGISAIQGLGLSGFSNPTLLIMHFTAGGLGDVDQPICGLATFLEEDRADHRRYVVKLIGFLAGLRFGDVLVFRGLGLRVELA